MDVPTPTSVLSPAVVRLRASAIVAGRLSAAYVGVTGPAPDAPKLLRLRSRLRRT
jgi:hypothetical protein